MQALLAATFSNDLIRLTHDIFKWLKLILR
jgi:hypothetical protein